MSSFVYAGWNMFSRDFRRPVRGRPKVKTVMKHDNSPKPGDTSNMINTLSITSPNTFVSPLMSAASNGFQQQVSPSSMSNSLSISHNISHHQHQYSNNIEYHDNGFGVAQQDHTPILEQHNNSTILTHRHQRHLQQLHHHQHQQQSQTHVGSQLGSNISTNIYVNNEFEPTTSVSLTATLNNYRHLDDYEFYREERLERNALKKFSQIMQSIKSNYRNRYQFVDDEDDDDNDCVVNGGLVDEAPIEYPNFNKILERHRRRYQHRQLIIQNHTTSNHHHQHLHHSHSHLSQQQQQ